MKSFKFILLSLVAFFALSQEVIPQGYSENNDFNFALTTSPTAAQSVYYTVKKGDTLSAIARMAGVSVKHIVENNDVHPKHLRIGQKLFISKPNNLTLNNSISNSNDFPAWETGLARAHHGQYQQQELLGTWNNPEERHLLVKVATSFLGAPYKLGGSTMRGIDCSAFVRMIYSIFDIHLPRNALAQSNVGTIIDRDELTEGDLVFFHTRRPFGHVGIYIGNNQFVHASYTCKVIRIDRLDTPYFQKRFQRAVRIKGLAGNDT